MKINVNGQNKYHLDAVIYILSKVQLNLWFNDSLDCIPTSNLKAMQMFWGHKIPFRKFHRSYRRSISRKLSWMKKLCFLTSLFQMPNIPAAHLTVKYLKFVRELLAENYNTEHFILCSRDSNWPRWLWYQPIHLCLCFQFKH